jgi:hypothetical protein
MGARYQVVQSARRYDMQGVRQGIKQAIQVNVDKVRGTYDESKYTNVVKATPYRRPDPIERST